jgi:hypothetical protein
MAEGDGRCDKILVFGKRVHSTANTETGENGEVLELQRLPSYPSVSANQNAQN